MQNKYQGAKVLITGGLGFIGSNLAIKLAEMGSEVTVLDVLWPDHGGNYYNIDPVKKNVHVNICDVRDGLALKTLVKGKDYIFHLAGQCSHVLGQVDPYPDIDINIHGTALLMETVKNHAPGAVTIYSSTRGVYGSVANLPADEEAPTNPKGLYELSNLTAEKIIKFYGDVHGLKIINLRLSNIYGERAQMLHAKFGVVNWFIRLALEGKTISVFGDGQIKRDFLYIDDCVDSMIQAAVLPSTYGETFNIGNDAYCTFLELVKTIISVTGSGSWEFAPFSPERAVQEPGDFFPDITKIKKATGWYPRVALQEGIARTVRFYRENKIHYW